MLDRTVSYRYFVGKGIPSLREPRRDVFVGMRSSGHIGHQRMGLSLSTKYRYRTLIRCAGMVLIVYGLYLVVCALTAQITVSGIMIHPQKHPFHPYSTYT
ncbi:hypothetical protein Krac_10441 [Ktedonobacter racemifer DSM 44963]|uniref:Uncharacterized protein n=1 Tax=Ktedonobacter racemifer DSM 44963 TaxID=485913 RepID=D6TGZ9_KTERA|nr:hypothetical protein Krac_10441 [Ktedonobacter racemifer DSM 44963]